VSSYTGSLDGLLASLSFLTCVPFKLKAHCPQCQAPMAVSADIQIILESLSGLKTDVSNVDGKVGRILKMGLKWAVVGGQKWGGSGIIKQKWGGAKKQNKTIQK